MANQKYKTLALFIKTYDRFVEFQKSTRDAMGLKKDGTLKKQNPKANGNIIANKPSNKIIFDDMLKKYSEHKDHLVAQIKKIVDQIPIYNCFLKKVKGVGPIVSGVIISTFDINIATTVSKMWAYAGVSCGKVKGKKWNKDRTKIITTEKLIPQDRLTKGYLSPYNTWLKSKLIGVLAASFIKCKSSYSEIYYNHHSPKAKRKKGIYGRLDLEEGWKDKTDGHRDAAAKRKMIKEFLKDLYVAWRTIEQLPVREPYPKEYLGKEHSK